MQANIPSENNEWLFIKDIDKVIRLDLGKHKEMLAQEQVNLQSYKTAVAHSIAKKKHYVKEKKAGKFDDDAMTIAIGEINTNTRHLSDKVKLTNDAIAHQTEIVDTLTAQLNQYEIAHAAADRCLQ